MQDEWKRYLQLWALQVAVSRIGVPPSFLLVSYYAKKVCFPISGQAFADLNLVWSEKIGTVIPVSETCNSPRGERKVSTCMKVLEFRFCFVEI